ncbi:MAG: 30S ribosomal protein S12 methylthiotransferase RimO [Calditrichaeota bacterium]|nr:30S ribosomal protein S12 methylthiotransferase RimO [Calditrichota bacterium]
MKINLTTLGCPKNIVDSEFLLGGLQGKNVEFVDDPLEAETIILNTCGFIQGAKEESIDAILEAVELKRRGSCKRVYVTGCLSQRYPDDLMREIPEVDGFFGNRDMSRVLRELTQELDLKREILGERMLTTPRHYAYLKISEGCENPCTFCSIPGIRGKFNSRGIEALVDEAHMLASHGVRELILVGQDITIYGEDLYGKRQLAPLLDKLSEIREFKWIRLLYTYPAHFSDDIIEILGDKRHVFNYVDMPIQHISDRLLRKMARKVTRHQIERIVQMLRQRSPAIAIRSTFLVGFPGETQADHAELCEFLQEIRFERLGLFTYSREEDTPAYAFPDQVPDYLMQERFAELNDLQNQVSLELNRALVGKKLDVLVEHFDREREAFVGRSHHDCPEIDNTVVIRNAELVPGEFYRVQVTGCEAYELYGEVVEQSVSGEQTLFDPSAAA